MFESHELPPRRGRVTRHVASASVMRSPNVLLHRSGGGSGEGVQRSTAGGARAEHADFCARRTPTQSVPASQSDTTIVDGLATKMLPQHPGGVLVIVVVPAKVPPSSNVIETLHVPVVEA